MFCDKVKTSVAPSLSSFNPNCVVVLKLIEQLEEKKKGRRKLNYESLSRSVFRLIIYLVLVGFHIA